MAKLVKVDDLSQINKNYLKNKEGTAYGNLFFKTLNDEHNDGAIAQDGDLNGGLVICTWSPARKRREFTINRGGPVAGQWTHCGFNTSSFPLASDRSFASEEWISSLFVTKTDISNIFNGGGLRNYLKSLLLSLLIRKGVKYGR